MSGEQELRIEPGTGVGLPHPAGGSIFFAETNEPNDEESRS